MTMPTKEIKIGMRAALEHDDGSETIHKIIDITENTVGLDVSENGEFKVLYVQKKDLIPV